MTATGAGLNGLLDALMEIAGARRDIMRRMRAALEDGNDGEALRLARQLCGLENHEQKQTGNRTDPGIN